MNKIAMPIKIAMLAAALILTSLAFTQTSKGRPPAK
jgi:hypothetical protein